MSGAWGTASRGNACEDAPLLPEKTCLPREDARHPQMDDRRDADLFGLSRADVHDYGPVRPHGGAATDAAGGSGARSGAWEDRRGYRALARSCLAGIDPRYARSA